MHEQLLLIYERNLDLARRLVADLDDSAMVAQPAPGMNHPAWVLAHLAATCNVVTWAIGTPPVAPEGWGRRFGARSVPVADVAAYPPKPALLEALAEGHEKVAEAVAGLEAGALAAPPADQRLRERWPTLLDALLHVMIGHEQMHLGQVSAWRRAQGYPAV